MEIERAIYQPCFEFCFILCGHGGLLPESGRVSIPDVLGDTRADLILPGLFLLSGEVNHRGQLPEYLTKVRRIGDIA